MITKDKKIERNILDKQVEDLFNFKGDTIRENANKDANTWSTKRDLLAGIVSKEYGFRVLIPKKISEMHLNGSLHYHDSDYSPLFGEYNCQLIHFKDMLANGFVMGNADIESAKGIETATALVSQIVANVSSNCYGGTTINRADEVLEPYAKLTYEKHLKDAKKYVKPRMVKKYAKDKTRQSIHNAIQSLEYELNTLYSSNGQTPFFTIGFGLGTSWYAREIQKAILKVRLEGLGATKKTAIFPKLIFVLKDKLNKTPKDPNYDIKQLAIKCATKRMYPDIVCYENIVKITGSFKFPMGCRSFLDDYKNEKGEYVTDGRMNLGVVTVNLVKVALETKTIEEYMKLLKERVECCREALEFRIKSLEKVQSKNAPILYMYGATGFRLGAEEYVSEKFKNGYASVSLGYIGLHEVATKFYGEQWQNNKEAKDFTLRVMKFLKDSVDRWKKETGYGFSLYSTPSESLCDRFCKIDQENFGDVKGITDKGYYTNSFHLDVNCQATPFEKLAFEQEYLQYTTGGFINYVEADSLVNNPKALETIWDYACDIGIGYCGVNTPIDKCFKCGYEGEFTASVEGFKCPNCGNTDPKTSSCVRRVCGYLSSPNSTGYNRGKNLEISRRVKHTKSIKKFRK